MAFAVELMPANRFVVLHHTGYGDAHFDLMLAEDDTGPLRTWRLSDWPPNATTTIVALPSHRRHYLTHEGAVSGGRGEVRRIADGHYESRQRIEADGVWIIALAGHALRLPLR